MGRRPQVIESEELPEADCLEGFAHPRRTAKLVGHEAAKAVCLDSFAANRLHHAWLIRGALGIGKATFAYALARYLLAENDERTDGQIEIDPASITARQVGALSHPRLMLIRRTYDPKSKRFSASIPVDEVRRLRNFLTHSTTQGRRRVIIVDQADDLNLSAANALLKVLEEPPERTHFLLISSEPGRLLATIKSRCRRLEMSALGDEDLSTAVGQALAFAGLDPIAPEDWQKLAAIGRGRVRRVLQLSQSDGVELYNRVQALIAALPNLAWSDVHSLADDLSGAGNEQRFEVFFELLLDYVARLIRGRATGVAAIDGGVEPARVIGEGRLVAWAEWWERVVLRKAEAMVLNLDRRALILETFSRLQAVAR